MGSSELEIHIALSLLPYLDARDVCRARGVNKHWNELFSSPDLLRAALRIYGSASREQQIITRIEAEAEATNSSSTSQLAPLDYRALFYSFSTRTHNLRRGTPIQELRFPIRRAVPTSGFVYAIADDVLVYLSPEAGGLQAVFWNHDTGEYANMRIDLGTNNQGEQPSAYSVRRLRVFEDVLVVEHTKEHRLELGSGSSFWSVVQVFRLTSPFAVPPAEGESAPRTGSYEQLSLFSTFKYRYVNYTDGIVSDHSRTHYAALSGRTNSLGVGVFVWDLLTGRMVFAYEQEALGTRNISRSPTFSADKLVMMADSHILLVKPDLRNSDKWRKAVDESTGFKLDILTFSLTVGKPREEDGVIIPGEDDCVRSHITRDKDDDMLSTYRDYIQWRVVRQRAPKLHHHDTPTLTTYLNLWGRQRSPLAPSAAALAADVGVGEHGAEEEEYPRRPISVGNDANPFFLNSNGTDALSFDLVWSGGSSECLGTRLMTFHFGIRSFQLTETSKRRGYTHSHGHGYTNGTTTQDQEPLRYHLDYSAYLKTPDEPTKPREIPSIQRNVLAMAQSHRGLVVAFEVSGDERMSIYTEPRQENNIATLVMCVWGSQLLRPVNVE
ncbi:hypothetical protein DRE_05452 [Drechslerella stenobrocha 248]|uniref:F-box domain-containing protein n=1 Tax=Drechslerella stenobrocha 248 TaxID=1043628 RepID=W7HQZ9_9PEZI|nr:hypothetical protein DRE_05452 [Drechslerella stenobrocha 248]